MTDNGKGFEEWAVLELMGHQQIAGLLTEQEIAGHAFLRVDVPETSRNGVERPGYTKYFGTGAVYAIHPCSEDLARKAAERLIDQRSPLPVHVPDLAAAEETIRNAERANRKLIVAAIEPTNAPTWETGDDEDGWDDPDDDEFPL